MWINKVPQNIDYFVGNEKARKIIVKWLKVWNVGTKPLLLIGPAGVGKTSFVRSLSKQFDLDLVDLNASDIRNKNNLDHRISPLLNNLSLTGKTFLLFLDEVDGILGREDFGALDYLLTILKNPNIRILMAANKKNEIIKEISKICKIVTFSPIPPRLLMIFLNEFLKKENCDIKSEDKKFVVENSFGDVRALLNGAYSKLSGYSMSRNNLTDLEIEETINMFFSSKNVNDALNLISSSSLIFSDPRFGLSSDERQRDLLNALFSSILMSKIDLRDLAPMLDILSKIDIIVGRVYTKRNWKMIRYLHKILTFSLFDISRNKYISYNRYNVSFQDMGNIFSRGLSLRNPLIKLSQKFHNSKSTFGSMSFLYFLFIISKKREFDLLKGYLGEKEIDSIKKEISRMMIV